MEFTLVAVVGVISIVAVAAFSQKLGVAAPLSLVVVGIGLSYVPGVPHPELDPDWVLAGVLPPLLYSGAVNMPVVDFRRNLKPITGLAVVLVAAGTLGSGWLFHTLLPGISWPAAFALGAVISPTDAVAATSVGRRLGLPHRLLTVLEGEGLVNDASALVLLRSALAAVAGSVSLWGIAGEFVYAVAVAVVVGLVVGQVNVRVRGRLSDPVLNTAVSFVIPFVAFVPAEELNASGVLAVVVAGLVTGHEAPRFLRAQDRLAEATNWRTLAFLLENTVFLLMGLSIKTLIHEVQREHLDVGRAVVVGLAASGVVIAVRMMFTAPLIAALRGDTRRAARVKPRLKHIQARLDGDDAGTDVLDRAGTSRRRGSGPLLDTEQKKRRFALRITRIAADVEFHLNQTLDWRGGVVLAWAGMRGVITVAAAQTLPEDTPDRPLLILIAFVVAATTLLLQGLTLPAVIRRVKVPADDPQQLRSDMKHLMAELAEAARGVLDDPQLRRADGYVYDTQVLDQARADSRIPGSNSEQTQEAPDEQADLREQYLDLRLRVLAAESECLLAMRETGTYSSAALKRAQHGLDIESSRLQRLSAADTLD
ncbi:cation:proton antiporter [Streptomyces sp. NPDC013178]|uniref:cation:proton antiporter n=1 Tax=Streptomyces sp. NPDC013178 TaxID=3155118 RepID=UPI0033F32103